MAATSYRAGQLPAHEAALGFPRPLPEQVGPDAPVVRCRAGRPPEQLADAIAGAGWTDLSEAQWRSVLDSARDL